jgi:hypothetical protein
MAVHSFKGFAERGLAWAEGKPAEKVAAHLQLTGSYPQMLKN